VKERFFAGGEQELPVVRYAPPADVDLGPLAAARRLCRRDDVVEQWLVRIADTLQTTADMLQAVGTREFSRRAQTLYGTPGHTFPGSPTTPLEMAQRLIRTTTLARKRMPDPPPPRLSAGDVAEEIRIAVRDHFGAKAPAVVVVRSLNARASAAPSRIRLRRGAKFSDLDVRQLIQHEAFVHVASALNGRRQRKMPILASNHAGTTRTQEGLAVFAELISGAIDPRRLLRLAHRMVAIDMALGGADFLEVYRYFKEHAPNRVEAYESTARVFRGGLLRGGAPFTKDMVYLDGLCRVHVFMRAAVDAGRIDMLPLLFAGKFDVEDLEAIAELERLELCLAPRFVPPWVEDPRRIVGYFTITDVITRSAASGLRKHYRSLLTRAHER
jgi:uncharacterized protein (TIGR02421 family)